MVELTKKDWQELKTQAEAMLKKAIIDTHQFTQLLKLSEDKIKEFE